MSSNKKKTLIEKFENLKLQYKTAFKDKLFEVCRKIGDQLFEIVEQLRTLGLNNEDLGLSQDGQYIIRSFEMVAKNPLSPNADAIFADAKRCANIDNEEGTPILRTIIGFETYDITKNGDLKMPEREEPEQVEVPVIFHTRNADLQRQNFNFTAFEPPLICTGLECANIHCQSRKTSHAGNPCIYSRPKTNQEIMKQVE